jgi:DNA-binding transcriptional MerR regulator
MNTGEPHPRWTIAELGERVSAALAEVEYEPPMNGQVRAIPDLRTIRYYTTLGLLDRPSAMRGRTALYGRRHLLQLVAIKRLQAEGRSLTEVQAALAGLDDAALAAIARVRVGGPKSPPGPGLGQAEAPEPGRRAARFWAAAPAHSSDADGAHGDPASRATAQPDGKAGAVPAGRAPAVLTTMTRIDLAPGVSVIIERAGRPGGLPLHAASIDQVDLARAAAPLLEALRRHGLASEDPEEEDRG